MKTAQRSKIDLNNAQGEHFLTIYRRPEYVYAKWKGHISADEVVKASQVYLKYIQEQTCSKLLNDKSEVTGDWQEANDYLEYEWLPAVYKAGLRCMAHIYSYSMFSQLSARELRDRVDPPLLMKNFMDYDAAETWLLKCRTTSPLPQSKTKL